MPRGLLLESFYIGSHKYWADNVVKMSKHDITLLTLPGRHWKWRMYGSALYFAKEVAALSSQFDFILCTDMMDVAVFKALVPHRIPILLYFHENQLTYPWSATDPDVQKGRDHHYGFMNITSAIAADSILFNSHYHLSSFFKAASQLLHAMPDHKPLAELETAQKKAAVLPIGIHLPPTILKRTAKIPRIVWNHRWEYDKNPELFFDTLMKLDKEDVAFELILLGERTSKYPRIFDEATKVLDSKIVHAGYVETKDEYYQLLQSAHLAPTTSIQDFFGISVVEAMANGCTPLLPERLAYPEHLSVETFPQLFYKTDKEFYAKLKTCTLNYNRLPQVDHSIQSYAWPDIIIKLDEKISSLLS